MDSNQIKIKEKLLALYPLITNEWSFKDNPSDNLLKNDPNAFLFAVIMDYGIKAEKAWAAPYELKKRLGHLDVKKLSTMSQAELAKVINEKPALHRFIKPVANFIINASKKLISEYAGDASNIWSGTSNSAEVITRLLEFDGMGHKKTHMMAKILVDELGIKLNKEFIDVEWDVHVKRVFKRAGLSRSDNFEDVILAGRILNPEYPAALDTPAWHIGRKWCHPTNPNCEECYISKECPRII